MIKIALILILFWPQNGPPLKPASQFEVKTNYQLKKKPLPENTHFVFDKPEEEQKETGTDLLPYLTIQLTIKRWHPDVEVIKIVDGQNKQHLKKKANDSGIYEFDLGYVDDIKDDVTSGQFVVNFMEGKKVVEIITITVENDGTFLVNGEKRGKF